MKTQKKKHLDALATYIAILGTIIFSIVPGIGGPMVIDAAVHNFQISALTKAFMGYAFAIGLSLIILSLILVLIASLSADETD